MSGSTDWTLARTHSAWGRFEYEIELERGEEGEELAFATVLVVDVGKRHEPCEPHVTLVSCDHEDASAWLEAEANAYAIGYACLVGVNRKPAPILQTTPPETGAEGVEL